MSDGAIMTAQRLFLVRHGQSLFNERYEREPVDPMLRDPALTKKGEAEAETLAETLRGCRIHRVLASPLTRALMTARILARALDVPWRVEPSLRERMYFESDIGTARSILVTHYREADFADFEDEWWANEREPYPDFVERLAHVLDVLAGWSQTHPIAVVTHSGVIEALYGKPTGTGQIRVATLDALRASWETTRRKARPALADAAFPHVTTASEYEEAMARWIDAMRTDDAHGDIEILARRKCRALGLDPAAWQTHVRDGLAQEGALGPDERDEYQRNIQRLFGCSERSPVAFPLSEIAERFAGLARAVCEHIEPLVANPSTIPVFLGTDGEYQKLIYDTRSGRRSRIFYMSRMTLMDEDELAALWETKESVFPFMDGIMGRSRSAADGSIPLRNYSWMDNALVSIVTYRIIQCAREARYATSEALLDAMGQALLEELVDKIVQRDVLARGWATLFGTPHPRIEASMREGIGNDRFARVVGAILDRFARNLAREAIESCTLVDLGASGIQPLLLAGCVRAIASASPSELQRLPMRAAHDPDLLAVLRAHAARLSIHLFCPRPSDWPGGTVLVHAGASWAFAMAIETIKTVTTSYGGAPPSRALANVSAPQELLAYIKTRVFRDVARTFIPGQDAPDSPFGAAPL